MNAKFNKLHLTGIKDNHTMNELFKTNLSDINTAFIKQERNIQSVDMEVKSIPRIITRSVEKVVAYTDAKFEEAILISKDHTNRSLAEERNRSDATTAQLEETVKKTIQTSEKTIQTSIQTFITELK